MMTGKLIMKLFLSSIGWIDDEPRGNRLRWSLDNELLNEIGLPDNVVIERANIPYKIPQNFHTSVSQNYPSDWWDKYKTKSLISPFLPGTVIKGTIPVALKQKRPVQAIRFRYHGPDHVKMKVYYRKMKKHILTKTLKDGEDVCVEAPYFDEIRFLSYRVRLENIETLDLYKERELNFDQITLINVKNTLTADFAEVLERYNYVKRTFNENDWQDTLNLLNKVSTYDSLLIQNAKPNPWAMFQSLLATRWEYAVLFGFGFSDGPDTNRNYIDKIGQDLLQNLLGDATVYRVTAKWKLSGGKKFAVRSNLSLCPPVSITPLQPPGVPDCSDCQVRLADNDDYIAKLKIHFQQNDKYALGYEFRQEITESEHLGSASYFEDFEYRSQMAEDQPKKAVLSRTLSVPFFDVQTRVRARSTDAWDRVSDYSDWADYYSFQFIHHVLPPRIKEDYEAGLCPHYTRDGTVILHLNDWQPDHLVTNVPNSRVCVFRRIDEPHIITVNATSAVIDSQNRFSTCILDTNNLERFREGYIIANNNKFPIIDIQPPSVYFRVTPNLSFSFPVFQEGRIKLQQSGMYQDLWTKITEFPVTDFPLDNLQFNDSAIVEINESLEILQYTLRVAYLDRLSQAGNVVTVLKHPAIPVTPPPFTINIIGTDYYGRTIIRLQFNSALTGGQYCLYWADGALYADTFKNTSQQAEYGIQPIFNNRYLYDAIPVSILNDTTKTITVGVLQINDGGKKSGFQIRTLEIAP